MAGREADSERAASPLTHLSPESKAERGRNFGAVAEDYERFRPRPPSAAVDWLLPERVGRVVDLGSGTGRLTRLLVGRAEEVVAVEPDERMRMVLMRSVPEAIALEGFGESIPLPDRSADAVLAASSWHWMEPVATLREVARLLKPGGTLGVMWTGPDRAGPQVQKAKAVHDRRPGGARSPSGGAPSGGAPSGGAPSGGAPSGGTPVGSGELSRRLMDEVLRPDPFLEVPAGLPFTELERSEFSWSVSMDADELVGLLGTFSWVLSLGEEDRAVLFAETRNLLGETQGIGRGKRVAVPFRTQAWRTHRLA